MRHRRENGETLNSQDKKAINLPNMGVKVKWCDPKGGQLGAFGLEDCKNLISLDPTWEFHLALSKPKPLW